jgi:RNA polymerase sigma-70 factor (ECF subfamily)
LSAPGLVEHFFRHEYGRLVAILVHRSGPQHLSDIEDAVQSALMTALREWPVGGRPDNPTAWLFRVAWRNLLGELRRGSGRRRLLEQNATDLGPDGFGEPAAPPDDEIADDLLRMLFVCCDGAIPPDSQLALALKTLCGFDVR